MNIDEAREFYLNARTIYQKKKTHSIWALSQDGEYYIFIQNNNTFNTYLSRFNPYGGRAGDKLFSGTQKNMEDFEIIKLENVDYSDAKIMNLKY